MKAKKHLGQHFLTSKIALKEIIKASNATSIDTILEIGPGKGVLTDALLQTGARIIAIETDTDMIAILNIRFKNQINSKQLTLVTGDILEVNIHDIVDGKYKVVANIPYYITGILLRKLFSVKNPPASITILVQKEVAERIAKNKKETILSLSVKVYGKPFFIGSVPARYFNPPPKVDSAILHIANISRDFFKDITEERFFKLVKAGFSSKRKKLVNNLSAFGSKEALVSAFVNSGLNADIRAEDIKLEDWKELSKALQSRGPTSRL